MARNPKDSNLKKQKKEITPEKAKSKAKRKSASFAIFTVLFCLFVAGCLTALIVGNTVLSYITVNMNGDVMIDLEAEKDSQNQTTILYANNDSGKKVELTRLHGTENRIWVDYSDIPQDLLWAFVCLEDKRFYSHMGVDWIRTIAVMIKPTYEGQGASTITQQLIKNITNDNEVTYNRKFNEIIRALNLEQNYSKNDILETYLNTVYLGDGCYGVYTAAENYFGKELSELTIAECAILASITKSPYSLNPFVNTNGKLQNRQKTCLDSMLDEGKITTKEHKAALKEKLVLADADNEDKSEISSSADVFSWYEEYVISQVISDLKNEYGFDSTEAWSIVYSGGLDIYTAVDLDIQDIVENAYENRDGFPSASKDQYDKLPQSAITIMDYDGRIVALAGGTGEKTTNRGYNRATDARAKRQPGSSIKPLSVYAPAIDLGLITPSSKILEKAIVLKGDLWPRNYNGDYGSGAYIDAETALARSLNTVPVRIVNEMLGVPTSFDYCNNKFHLNLSSSDMDLSPLCVGGTNTGVTTLEMASAFATFGNGGRYFEGFSYYKVVERDTGKILLDNTNNLPEQAISETAADSTLSMMTTAVTATYGTGYGGYISGFQTFAKTGTTSDNCDKWFCGGTPEYVTSVWYGYDYRSDLRTGSSNPAKTIFASIFSDIHEGLPKKTFSDVKDEIDDKVYSITNAE